MYVLEIIMTKMCNFVINFSISLITYISHTNLNYMHKCVKLFNGVNISF